ncbi:MAG: hypothetical protein O3C40_35255 [Planctomycetota bacterium]|nr:hypothetical protein [Planctomycetota bacterium]
MSSISASDYQNACVAFIESALKHPRMYFDSLKELETLLRGHETAFQQLGGITANESFHVQFADWLLKTKQLSGAAGWAEAIESLAEQDESDPEAVFGELVRQFFSQSNS